MQISVFCFLLVPCPLFIDLCLLIILFSLWVAQGGSWAYSLAPTLLTWFVRVLLWDGFARIPVSSVAPFKNLLPRGSPGLGDNAVPSVRSSKVQSPTFHLLLMWPLVTSLTSLSHVLPPRTGEPWGIPFHCLDCESCEDTYPASENRHFTRLWI